ncbi:related to acetylxylan esterase precursor [Ramularia collo-cygni]|uniref:Related to acetylxylan esterase n=1 Tax=Ramularia collo-cygni TaxID=112498 RepID=A0A2D3VRQ2_9PEZI|nr:related to acetylxylan esterase precursor [Ramularia collo-cygni]CZT25098.1 related to acetylxylan esterase precursor [Ramularia collo-cygni]
MQSIAKAFAISAFAAGAVGQSCPNIHIFGARETTAPAGYGTGGEFIDLILNAYSGATAEAIDYPAQGDGLYASSVQQGTKNIASQINSFNTKCPDSKLVVVGYSQGAQIGDNALCGGGDPNQGISDTKALLTSSASAAVKAIIWAGNPRNSPVEKSAFGHGSCTASGFDPRPSGFSCSIFQARIRSYCDAADPYCCNGSDAAAHQAYGQVYGQDALTFVKSKLG